MTDLTLEKLAGLQAEAERAAKHVRGDGPDMVWMKSGDALALLAMARELVRLKSALAFLDKDAFACFSYLDPRKPAPHALDETEHGDNFTAPAFLALATDLGWPDPLPPSERKGEG